MLPYKGYRSNKIRISMALKDLGLSKTDLREIPRNQAKPILKTIKDRFTTNQNTRWWWEYFRETLPMQSARFNYGYQLIDKVVPSKEEKVWLVTEEGFPNIFRLYIGKPTVIKNVLGECPSFEYYLVGLNYKWLVCENHHDYIMAVGDTVVERFTKLLNELT